MRDWQTIVWEMFRVWIRRWPRSRQKTDAMRIAEAAGFVVEADSGLLHMHDDDLTQGVFAECVRGKTHRFLLKLRKPVD